MSQAENFRTTLETVLGQALHAAGYSLEFSPVQWSGGFFRFRREVDDAALIVVFQMLAHEEYPSRFQVILARRQPDATHDTDRITLPELLWDVFHVQVLPAPEHWWHFSHRDQLAESLMEAGKLLVGYGLPWLDGSLKPGR